MPDRTDHPLHSLIALLEITAVDTQSSHTGKSRHIIIGIHNPRFRRLYANAPAIVLYEINNRQLLQDGKLKGLTHLPFRYTGITQAADNHRALTLVIGLQQGGADALQVLYTLSYT